MVSVLFRLFSRSCKGQNQVEFAAAFSVLIVLVLVPLVNLSAVPMRTGLAQAIVKDTIKRLSLSEKFSEAVKASTDGTLEKRLDGVGGVTADSIKVSLRISKVGSADKFVTVERPGSVPKDWLPDGANAPVNVQIVLAVKAKISPLVLGSTLPGKIPGLTVPFDATFEETAGWENLGRNSNSGEYFLNE